MRRFKSTEELQAVVGQDLGYSGWHAITQDQVNLFADATSDHQWIHVDPERAASGPFGSTVAHGYLTLSLLPRLVGQVYVVDNTSISVNYGSNKVRFPSPVPVGSRVRARVTITSVESTSRGDQVIATVSVEREGSERPVCVAEIVSLLVP